jgi:hypothetical protein
MPASIGPQSAKMSYLSPRYRFCHLRKRHIRQRRRSASMRLLLCPVPVARPWIAQHGSRATGHIQDRPPGLPAHCRSHPSCASGWLAGAPSATLRLGRDAGSVLPHGGIGLDDGIECADVHCDPVLGDLRTPALPVAVDTTNAAVAIVPVGAVPAGLDLLLSRGRQVAWVDALGPSPASSADGVSKRLACSKVRADRLARNKDRDRDDRAVGPLTIPKCERRWSPRSATTEHRCGGARAMTGAEDRGPYARDRVDDTMAGYVPGRHIPNTVALLSFSSFAQVRVVLFRGGTGTACHLYAIWSGHRWGVQADDSALTRSGDSVQSPTRRGQKPCRRPRTRFW